MKKALVAATLLLISVSAHAAVDLNNNAIYAKKGFSESWLTVLPPEGSGWVKIPAAREGRRIHICDLPIQGIPHHQFFSFTKYRPEEFTLVTDFEMTRQDLTDAQQPGIKLASIGINWEVFINGHSIRRQIYMSGGKITRDKYSFNVVIPLDMRHLKEGKNILAMKIIGDPSFKLTGLYRKGPYKIGDFDTLLKESSETIDFILISLYLTMGIYFIYLYFTRSESRFYLFYGIFSCVLCMYILSRSTMIGEIIPDSMYVRMIEHISLYMTIPLLGMMLDYFLFSKASLFSQIYISLCTLLSLADIILSQNISDDLLFIWQVFAPVPMVLYFYRLLRHGFMIDYCRIHLNNTMPASTAKSLMSLQATLLKSFSGNIVLGAAAALICASIDLTDAVFFSSGTFLTRYGFLVFIISIALVLSNRFTSMHRQTEILNDGLQSTINTMREANYRLALSEEKYRFLIDYSADFIFMLNEQGFITNASNAMIREFVLKTDSLQNHSFFDFIHAEDPARPMELDIAKAQFEELLQSGKPVKVKIKLQASNRSEPKDFNIHLERVVIEGNIQIMGKATHIVEDTMLSFFRSERQIYSINNYLISSEQMTQRIVRNATKYLPSHETDMLRVAIREILINAIEHGNLNITYDEKTAAMAENRYLEFIKERQNKPAYRDKKVTVEYMINEEKLVCKITDEGQGFDYTAMLSDEGTQEANSEMLPHGRGITMTRQIFDEITYNRKGNQVLLVKRFKKSSFSS